MPTDRLGPSAAIADGLEVQAQRCGEVATTDAQAKPPVQQPSVPFTGWVEDFRALADAAFTRAQLSLAPSVPGDPDAIAARTTEAHRKGSRQLSASRAISPVRRTIIRGTPPDKWQGRPLGQSALLSRPVMMPSTSAWTQ